MIDPKIILEARRHAMEEYPRESCGLVYNGAYHRSQNIADDQLNDFLISSDEYPLDYEIDAIIHSHPEGNPYPSQSDMESQIATDVLWGIIVVNQDPKTCELRSSMPVWFGDTVPVPPLLERPFTHGITDCYSLIRDYYRLERNILLPNFPRSWEWWSTEQDLYRENFAKAGFKEISASEVKEGDVFLASIKCRKTNHGGIILGNNLILHHLQLQVSRRETCGRWSKYFTHYLRYHA